MIQTAAHPREDLLLALYDLFRERGFEGVSIADICEATGLGRSSLYHHFPGGKADMAEAVAAYARAWLDRAVIAALSQPGPRAERVQAMLSAVDALYEGGGRPCVVASLLLGRAPEPLARRLSALLGDWLEAIAAALIDTGCPANDAHARAAQALARVQGALTLARALNRRAIFAQALEAVRAELLA